MPRRSAHSSLLMDASSPVRTRNVPRMELIMPIDAIRNGRTIFGAKSLEPAAATAAAMAMVAIMEDE